MPGYRPSAFGAATKVRIAGPDIGISTYSVVITIVWCESGEDVLPSQGLGWTRLRSGCLRRLKTALGGKYSKVEMVGTTGFEPATSRTPSGGATRLRYV